MSASAATRDRSWWVGILFLVTFTVLIGLIIAVLIEGDFGSMMALSGVAYALASLGFLSIIGYVFMKGQFVDYEAIKEEIFEIEERGEP